MPEGMVIKKRLPDLLSLLESYTGTTVPEVPIIPRPPTPILPAFTQTELADKKATTKRRSLVNFDPLNRVLRFEIFLHQDSLLCAVHVTLGFKPMSNHFQVSKHVIKARDSCLVLVDVAIEEFIRKPPLEGT